MVLGQLRSQTVAVVTHSRRRCTATQAPRRGACRYLCLGSVLRSLLRMRPFQIYVLFLSLMALHVYISPFWSTIGCLSNSACWLLSMKMGKCSILYFCSVPT